MAEVFASQHCGSIGMAEKSLTFSQVQDILKLKDKPFSLVLEEDGTIVETEEYFQALARDTVFMVLLKGQKWKPPSEQVTASWGRGECGELGRGS